MRDVIFVLRQGKLSEHGMLVEDILWVWKIYCVKTILKS